MGTPLRLLIVEDSPDDADLVVRELHRGGYDPVPRRVETATAMLVALEEGEWDVIIADYSMPNFSASAALRLMQQKGLDLPFIVVSGSIGEETAVAMMKAGAHDYLMKNDLRRLPSAIEREVREAFLRRDRRRAHEELVRARDELEKRVAERTRSLSQTVEALHREAADRNRAEHELERTRQELHAQMKSNFVALAAHQLKTPVGILNGYIQNMLSELTGPLTPKQKEYLKEMLAVSSQNFRLISDLLNVSQIEHGVTAKLESIPLREVVEFAAREYRKSIENKRLHLEIKEETPELRVFADRDKLIQSLANVLHNAIKFTDKGTISIRTRQEEGFGVIEVADTGRGMPDEVLRRVFSREMMFSGPPVAGGGTGLGMYISHEFMRAQHGGIYASSKPGSGSCFTLRIPLEK